MAGGEKQTSTFTEVTIQAIGERILFIRGEKVLLDSDLAGLYDVETKMLTRAVKRNIERFPEDFMFQLSTQEFDDLKYQFGTSSMGWAAHSSIRFYRTGSGHAIQCLAQQESRPSQYSDHESFCSAATIAGFP